MIEQIELNLSSVGIINSVFIVIIIWLEDDATMQNIINIGKEAVTVYNIKYMLACMRSGWYPHSIINNMVGIKEASNQT
jgi:hypothetical protein